MGVLKVAELGQGYSPKCKVTVTEVGELNRARTQKTKRLMNVPVASRKRTRTPPRKCRIDQRVR